MHTKLNLSEVKIDKILSLRGKGGETYMSEIIIKLHLTPTTSNTLSFQALPQNLNTMK